MSKLLYCQPFATAKSLPIKEIIEQTKIEPAHQMEVLDILELTRILFEPKYHFHRLSSKSTKVVLLALRCITSPVMCFVLKSHLIMFLSLKFIKKPSKEIICNTINISFHPLS